MTGSNHKKPVADQTQPEDATRKILELLDKLSVAESLGGAALSAGVSEDQVRAGLQDAAEIIRQSQLPPQSPKRWPIKGSILDWREMTVAEALEILADHAAGRDQPLDPTS